MPEDSTLTALLRSGRTCRMDTWTKFAIPCLASGTPHAKPLTLRSTKCARQGLT